MTQTDEIDFGFRKVAREEKQGMVREVFDNVAENYDLMNDLMSAGLHRLWKDAFVTWLRPRAGMKILDLAGGTGDIAFRMLEASARTGEDGTAAAITVCDINAEMLRVGEARARKKGLDGDLEWVCANGEALPFDDASFDAATIAFGIRNVTDKPACLRELFRVLKPGGRFMCLEFSRLALAGLDPLYDAYSFKLVPLIGRYVAKDEPAYQYLVESIRMFPDQESFAAMIAEAGFEKVTYENLSGGVAAMHSGWKI